MDQKKRGIIKGSILIIAITIIVSLILKKECNYMAYINNQFIGYIEDKATFKEEVRLIEAEVKKRFPIQKDIKSNITFKSVSKGSLTNQENVEEEIKKCIEVETEAYRMYINNKFIGYVANEAEGHEVLKIVGNEYKSKLDENKFKIDNINIKCKTEYKKESIKINEAKSVEDIAHEIIEKNSNNQLLDVEIKYIYTKSETIPPSKIIRSNDNIYMGDKIIEKGEEGIKEVTKEVTLLNNKKKEEKIIRSNVVKDPKDEIIYEGSKNPIKNNVAFLSLPSRGGITSNYGSRWGVTHHGIDIAGNIGDPIKASANGIVVNTSYDDIYGNKVMIEHGNGIVTLYGHCSEVLVKVGESVEMGECIAKIGTTGRSTGPHLHFELRENGKAINPINFIK